MSRRRGLRSLLALLVVMAPAVGRAEPIQSPWWEDYALRDRELCRDKATLVLARNDAQASLIQGRYRSTFFREASDEPGLRFSGDGMRLILNGDELTLERLPQRIQCLRTDQV
ncbi:MAG: hypothetical protein ACKO5M_02360 [Vulcanococcus sp.]